MAGKTFQGINDAMNESMTIDEDEAKVDEEMKF